MSSFQILCHEPVNLELIALCDFVADQTSAFVKAEFNIWLNHSFFLRLKIIKVLKNDENNKY